MAANKLITNSSQIELNNYKKIPPIETRKDKPAKLKSLADSLIAPIEKIDVPNYVLNTKIYAKLQRNELIEASPHEIHFSGFEIVNETNNGKKSQQLVKILKLINISGKIQRMTILPPQTKYFDVHYVKPERLVPGFALEVKVIFKPDEYRYYNDSIKIFCEDEDNLLVPIHAYPIFSSHNFPSNFSFPNVPIGKSMTKSFTMKSSAPIEFEYMIEILQTHPAFTIEPCEGVIPYDREAYVNVTFKPKEFCTAVMMIQLIVSQFNSKPIVCTFYGTSLPGLERDKILAKLTSNSSEKKKIELSEMFANETQISTILNETTKNMSSKKLTFNQSNSKDVASKQSEYVDVDGYRFPTNLNNTWNVSKVLMQTRYKLSIKDLRLVSSKKSVKISAQAKEQFFLQRVNELEDEERKNQLKWQVKLGETLIDEKSKEEILRSRAQAMFEYHLSIGVPFLDQEIERVDTQAIDCRTVRDFDKLPRTDITFDLLKNKRWTLRLLALDKFIQTARKVILKNRLTKVLSMLRKFIGSWNETLSEPYINNASTEFKLSLENYIDIYCKRLNGQNLDQNEIIKGISQRNIGTYYFPQVVEFKELQNQKARHCEKLLSISKLDSLGLVAVKPIEFQIKLETPYINLATPILYKLNSYKQLTNNSYVSKHEGRLMKLRTGAEDELTQIISDLKPESQIDVVSDQNRQSSKPRRNSNQTLLDEKSSISSRTTIIDLKPSKKLAEPVDYPPLHIFNPVPGLISFQKQLPYSGIELNHHLNPLPRFEREQTFSTQKRFLDREDVIKGIMTWKKFPSQSLTALTSTPTLADVWVPRWSNRFSSDIIPAETPELLSFLPEDDKQNLADDEDETASTVTNNKESKIKLTPETVNAQFNIPEMFESRERNAREETTRLLNRATALYRSNLPEMPFPLTDKLPANNNGVSIFGQIPRNQREQELEYFINKQYNSFGIRVQSKLNAVDQQFQQQSSSSQNINNQSNNSIPLTNSSQTQLS